MKSFLTIAWVLIIAGGIYIAFTVFKPQPVVELDLSELSPIAEEIISAPIENTPIEEFETVREVEILPVSRLAPATFTEHLAAGDQYLEEGSVNAAISEYKEASSISPQSTETLIKLGQAYLANSEPEAAKISFESALQLEPGSLAAQLGIARSHLNTRDTQTASNIIAGLDQEQPEIKYYTAILLVLGKDFEAARIIFEDILNNSGNKDLSAKSQIFLDKYRTYGFFVESDPIHLQTLLSKALSEVKEFQAAIPLLFDVINEKNNYRDAWTILGFSYLNVDQSKDAIDALTQAEALSPEDPQILFFLGLSYFADSDIEQAIFYLEKADQLGYQPQEAIDIKLGELYLQQGESRKAAVKYESIIAKDPSNINLFVRSIWLNIERLDNPEKAFELAEKAIKYHPQKAMSYNLMGWTLNSLGEYEEAKENLNKALAINPELESAHYNFGQLYEQQGQDLVAKQYYKTAFDLGKGNDISRLAADRYNKLYQANTFNLSP